MSSPPPPPPLYALGSNGSSQLALGHGEDISIPAKCVFESREWKDRIIHFLLRTPQEKSNVAIKNIVAGGNHTLIHLSNGLVYAAGENTDGRCGYTGSRPNRFRPVVVSQSEDGLSPRYALFSAVSATWEGSILVATGPGVACGPVSESERKADKAFVLGSGFKGELGLGEPFTGAGNGLRMVDFPPEGRNILSLASGMGHTVAVLSGGGVWGWGASRKGQLGIENVEEKIVWRPTEIGVPGGMRVTGVVCGREFTVLLGDRERGEILVLGNGGGVGSSFSLDSASASESGSGSGSETTKAVDKWGIISNIPRTEDIKGYKKVLASWHAIYIHKADGTLLSWGRNDRGQLPPADLDGVAVKDIAVGSEHGLVLLENGEVVAFGWGEHGNCGPETDEKGDVKGVSKKIPLELPEGKKVVGLGGGCATSWIVTE
ncbi:RCC1 domain-containing protein [Aspergillus stella-maris]|uniref:RCC1 domain-containing protein n=1 Tax=Aspergillus stella-maris TaxID=1810926 RepID=UPI003CCC9EDE